MLKLMNVDVVIVGAGPYGLSIAAHLAKSNLTFRVFGTPMQTWREHMPKGMLLKSEGFATGLYDPDRSFTLKHYCEEMNLPYGRVGVPVALSVFAAYGQEFQKRMVPMLEQTDITSVIRVADGTFQLETADGQTMHAKEVILAAGITHFPYMPPFLANIPEQYASHGAKYHDLSGFKGKSVVVLGAGASAIDIAAILNEEGAETQLVARRHEIAFHSKAKEPRPLHQRIRYPRSGLGIGWDARLCTDAPWLYHMLPQKFRFRFVREHLGPAPGWFVKEKVLGKFPTHMGCKIQYAEVLNGKVHLHMLDKTGSNKTLVVDHIISATGYRTSVSRIPFLDDSLRKQIDTAEDTPILTQNFETSVRGLYMVGVAASHAFGPLMRFAFGARYTSKRLSKHVIARLRSSASARTANRNVGYATE
jgi:thioredoxin reductase